MITQPIAIFAVLVGAIVFSLEMVKRYTWAARLSTVIWVIFTSALLSNLGLIPTDAPLYGSLIDFTVPFAVCVILLTVNLADVRSAGKPMLAAFALATVGTVLGVAIASVGLSPLLEGILGDNAWKLAGPYTGTYIGGSLNFFALWTGLEIGNPDLLAAANAVDNLTLFPLYALWMAIPMWMAGKYVTSDTWAVPHDEHEGDEDAAPELNTLHITTLVFITVLIMAVSAWVKETLLNPVLPAVPTILVVTTLALIGGQIPFIRRLKGAWEIGDLAFYVFFASVGALINFYQAVILSPSLFLFVVIVMAIHMAVVYGGGRLLGMDVGVLTIASVATKAGPALVLPVAEAKGWRNLVVPGIIIGMLGYAIGNYIGFGVAYAVRAVIG